MPKEIYNVGRVVGLSAYEVYVKHHMSENPEVPPASEREWLSSQIGSGSSLLIKLSRSTAITQSSGQALEVHAVNIPANSRIVAANTIVGSLFQGTASCEGNNAICNKVTSYGNVIELYSSKNDNVPYTTVFSEDMLSMIKEYTKIVDGGIVLNGDYVDEEGNPATGQNAADLKPDLYKSAQIRIFVKGHITRDVFILLTGFSMKSVISGISGLDGSTSSISPEDGDFLGPAIFPWANKIVFSVPSSYTAYYQTGSYTRKLADDAAYTELDDTAIVDMRKTDPKTYYQQNPKDQNNKAYAVSADVSSIYFSGSGAGILTVYSYDGNNLPPALFGSYVTEKGQNAVYPLDVVSPGTVKMWNIDEEEAAKLREELVPGNYSIIRNDAGELFTFNDNGELQPIAQSYVTKTNNVYIAHTEVGIHHTKSVALTDDDEKDLNLRKGSAASNTDSSVPDNTTIVGDKYIGWGDLLEALSTDTQLDILGYMLRHLRSKLPDIDTTGLGDGVIKITGKSGQRSSIGGPIDLGETGTKSTVAGQVELGQAKIVDKNYITFGNGLRLYISADEPVDSDIPVGSIGIGWTE